MNEYHPEDTGAETPQEGTGPESGAEPRPARNEGFTDASYIPRDRMPKTPRVYTYGESEEKKTRPEREKKSHRRMRGGTIVALCVVCILLGAVLGILAMDRLTGPASRRRPLSALRTRPPSPRRCRRPPPPPRRQKYRRNRPVPCLLRPRRAGRS